MMQQSADHARYDRGQDKGRSLEFTDGDADGLGRFFVFTDRSEPGAETQLANQQRDA